MRLTVLRTTSEKLTRAPVVISPASTTILSLTRVSAATREVLSCARMASRTASEIWSAAFPAKKVCQSSTAISPTQPTPSHFRPMLFLLRLAARLPLRLAHALGAVLGWMIYLCSPRYRKDFKRNLATAGLSDFRLRCSAVAEAGKSVMEVPAVWLRPLERVAGFVVEVSGWEHVDDGARRGKGVIVVTPHIGCWEVVGQYVASRMPITVMYRTPKIRALEPLMRIGRGRGPAMKSVPADLRGVRAMLKALKRGEAIGLLPDQVPGIGEGEWVEFFGKP